MESVMKASSLCRVIGVLVDEKGRISTMLKLMASDLRNLIDHKDLCLSYHDKILILRAIASGMKELHGCGFIHKDLKASKVLVSPILFESMCTMKGDMFGMNLPMDRSIFATSRFHYTNDLEWIDVKIGDYKHSNGVVGTWCFKAPKVLRALRDGTNVKYSPAMDVMVLACFATSSSLGNFLFKAILCQNMILCCWAKNMTFQIQVGNRG